MEDYVCENCSKEFQRLTQLRLHEKECEKESTIPDGVRVKALDKVGTGSSFQSMFDRRKRRLTEHNIMSIEDAAQNLRETIRAFGSENLVEELWYHELIRAGSFSLLEVDTGIAPKLVEYLYGMAVTVPPTDSKPTAGFYDVLEAAGLVHDRFRVEQSKILSDASSTMEKRRAHAQEMLLERELTTGRFGHGEQRREFTRRVYTKLDDELSDAIGVSATEAVAVGDGIVESTMERFGDDKLLRIARKTIDIGDGPFQIRAREIEQSPDDPLARCLLPVAKYDYHRTYPIKSEFGNEEHSKYDSKFGSLRQAGPLTSFSSADLEIDAIDSTAHLKSILDSLSITIGSYDSELSQKSGAISKFDYPFDHNPIHKFPLIKNQEGDYYHGPQNALWYSFSTRFRYDLLTSEHSGHAAEEIGFGIENWVLECLQNVSDKNVKILSNVQYDHRDGESDIVLLYDDTLVVIECKTRGLRLKSRLGPFGDFETIAKDAREVLKDPYEKQAMKLIRSVKKDKVSELRSNGDATPVSSSDFSEYIPAVIVGEPLDVIGTVLHTNLIEIESERPFFGDVFAWQTICRNVSGSEELLSYLRKRIEVGTTGRAFSADEADYLGAYLDHGLEYPGIPEEGLVDIHHQGTYLENDYMLNVGANMEHL